MSEAATLNVRARWQVRAAAFGCRLHLDSDAGGVLIFRARFRHRCQPLQHRVQSSILLLLALPMTLIIMSEGLDLSIGAVLGLAGVVLAMVLVRGGGVALALGAALCVGSCSG
jgi:ribose/xylose/arabinose/galactoside ABC-type transport system permease subunit